MSLSNKQKALIQHLIDHHSYDTKEAIEAVKTLGDCDHIDRDDVGFNREFTVLTDDEADEAAIEYVKESVWAFNPSFLSTYTDLPMEVFEALQPQCEGANDAILALINNGDGSISDFTNDAVSCDGRGHFLNGYDGEEYEYYINGEYYYVYEN